MVASKMRPKFPDRNAPTPGGEAGETPAGRSNSVRLKVAPVGVKAARHAVQKWHYSGTLPVGKTIKVGVWEEGRFIGCIIYARGANRNMGARIGLPDQRECVELARVALTDHQAPVSQIIALSFKELRAHNPGIRAVMSYADPQEGHHGGIYQAGGWTYIGPASKVEVPVIDGVKLHKKTAFHRYGTNSIPKLKAMGLNVTTFTEPAKHTYAIGFDRQIRNRLKAMSKTPPAPLTRKAGS